MKARGEKRVWVVIHCEFMDFGGGHSVLDEVVFHVAASRRQAVSYIKKRFVASYSWWRVQWFTIDDDSTLNKSLYYNHQGKPVKEAPHKQALAAFRKQKNKKKKE